jgi:hypothetical protein
MHHKDTNKVEGHTSGIEYHIYPLLSITITTFAAKESVVITFVVIFWTHFNVLEKTCGNREINVKNDEISVFII